MSRDEQIDFSGDDRSRCPVCKQAVPIDSDNLTGNERCPHCGQMLFWLRLQPGIFLFYRYQRPDRARERVIGIVARQLGVDKSKITPPTSFVNDLGLDSLNTVELVMELEEMEDECF